MAGFVAGAGAGGERRRELSRCAASPNLARGTSLRSFAGSRGWGSELESVCGAIKEALCVTANRVRRAGLEDALGSDGFGVNASGEERKALDVVANEVLFDALQGCSAVSVVASEEEDEAWVKPGSGAGYTVVFDPLDGSSNIAACIPTGTIFGVYRSSSRDGSDVLQKGSSLALAGYCLYSAATILVLSDGDGTHGFTLDADRGDFVLSHPNLRVPEHGSSYSVNDGRYHDWPKGLQHYIDDIKTGKGRQQVVYDTRYICSLVADVHYVLFRGGIAMNPRDHLRLVYEGNPIAFVVENAGGAASNGVERILDVEPSKLHHRLPLFVGSKMDIDELHSYNSRGGVQQLHNPGYKY